MTTHPALLQEVAAARQRDLHYLGRRQGGVRTTNRNGARPAGRVARRRGARGVASLAIRFRWTRAQVRHRWLRNRSPRLLS
jgi:hypothetical protein